MIQDMLDGREGLREAGLALRPCLPDDETLLEAVFAANRAAEFLPLGWDAAALRAFLQGQFRLQRRQYGSRYPAMESLVIERNGAALGHFSIDTADAWRLIEIALLPEACNQGVGGRVIAALQAAAAESGVEIALTVTAQNPARRLYERWGFQDEGTDGYSIAMRWRPPDLSGSFLPPSG